MKSLDQTPSTLLHRLSISLLVLFLFTSAFISSNAFAAAPEKNNTRIDKNDDKLIIHKVVDDIYAIVGPTGNRSPKNLANNATFGFVITTDGVVLIDPGGTFKGAKRIHDTIQTITDKPVKFVINTGGQDHRWLGNDYFQKVGAKIIASKDAVIDQKERVNDILTSLSFVAGEDALKGTIDKHADITFDNQYSFMLGETKFEINHPGAAHSPGDSYVWLPQHSVIFTGDIVYTERLLGIMSFSNSKSWVSAYETMASHKPKHVVPGHGNPTTLTVSDKDTYGYLKMLRKKVTDYISAGGVIEDVGKTDQSPYKYLKNYDDLKGRNIQQVYQEIEFE